MAETQTQTETPAAKETKKRSKLPFIIVLVLMIGEGAAIFAVTKVFFAAGPADSHGAEPDPLADHGEHGAGDAQLTAELEIAECRPSNLLTGKLVNFKIRVSALVAGSDQEKAKALVEAHKGRITDRVNFIVRSAEPHHLAEPGLDTIKRRMKHEMDAILEDEHLIKEILIPELLQSGPGL